MGTKRLTKQAISRVQSYVDDVRFATNGHNDLLLNVLSDNGKLTDSEREDLIEGLIISEDKLIQARAILERR